MKIYLTALSAFMLLVCFCMNFSSENAQTQSLNAYAQSMSQRTNRVQDRKLQRAGSGSSSSSYRGLNFSYYRRTRIHNERSDYRKSIYDQSNTLYNRNSTSSSKYYSYAYQSSTYIPLALSASYSYGVDYSNKTAPVECQPRDEPCIKEYQSTQTAKLSQFAFILSGMCVIAVCACIGASHKSKKKARKQGETGDMQKFSQAVVKDQETTQGVQINNWGRPLNIAPNMVHPAIQNGDIQGRYTYYPPPNFNPSQPGTIPVMEGQPPMQNYPAPIINQRQ